MARTLENGKNRRHRSSTEIEKDVARLNTIANRFSKIGSLPTLKKLDIIAVTKNAYEYLEYRSSEHIIFELQLPEKVIIIPFNTQLISWTLENLIKNGIDAMKGKGTLKLRVNELKNHVEILISDTGLGMKKEIASKIFSPGFTTKSRGWGLG